MLLIGAVMVFAQSPQALIRELAGTVEIKKPGSADWTAARAGDQLEKAAILSTGFKSSAVLVIGDSTLMVKPLTRLSLDELLEQDNAETVNLGLRTGRIQASVTPPADHKTNLTVRTPTATASVRGTRFSMNPVSLKVTEGSVWYEPVSAQGRPTLVNAGQSSRIDTETGNAVNPLVQAEAERGLPVLAGETTASSDEGGTVQTVPKGTVEIELELEK